MVAGHKGRPERIEGRAPRRGRLKGAPGRGTLAKEKPPVFGIVERGGEVRIAMLADVRQGTIRPLIEEPIAPGARVNTDEYAIYDALPEWGYVRKSLCHSRGEYARDEEGDGFHEVHVNTMEGFWSLLRSWLRRTGASRRKSCRFTWASSSSYTTSGGAAGPCWDRCWTPFYSCQHVVKTQYEPGRGGRTAPSGPRALVMRRALIDTNIYSLAMRGDPDVVDRLQQLDEIGFSVVSLGELPERLLMTLTPDFSSVCRRFSLLQP